MDQRNVATVTETTTDHKMTSQYPKQLTVAASNGAVFPFTPELTSRMYNALRREQQRSDDHIPELYSHCHKLIRKASDLLGTEKAAELFREWAHELAGSTKGCTLDRLFWCGSFVEHMVLATRLHWKVSILKRSPVFVRVSLNTPNPATELVEVLSCWTWTWLDLPRLDEKDALETSGMNGLAFQRLLQNSESLNRECRNIYQKNKEAARSHNDVIGSEDDDASDDAKIEQLRVEIGKQDEELKDLQKRKRKLISDLGATRDAKKARIENLKQMLGKPVKEGGS